MMTPHQTSKVERESGVGLLTQPEVNDLVIEICAASPLCLHVLYVAYCLPADSYQGLVSRLILVAVHGLAEPSQSYSLLQVSLMGTVRCHCEC